MKKLAKHRLRLLFLLPVLFYNCSDDDYNEEIMQPDQTVVNSITYDLGSVAVEGISGTAEFKELSDGSVTVDLALQNTPADGQHPAHIHFNTAVEGGDIAITLGTVDGNTGESTINFTTLDDGTPITYSQLLDFDGYINVHLSSENLSTIVAQGDIGQNTLTGNSKSYALGSVAVPEIDGSATFYERNNGEALAVIQLNNTPADGEHPGHIHMNTAVEGGGIIFTFNPVIGATGVSKTNVSRLDDDTPFGYDDVLNVNGYINIHLSAEELSTIVAQGDIGQNELTGEVQTYDLNERDVAGISGTIEFAERVNETTLVTISLAGTTMGASHPAHIHQNDVITSGPIIVGLNPVNGDTGISRTQVSSLDGGSALTYADLLTIDGYVNVHLSDADLATIVAQGNIGVNANDSGGSENKTYDVSNNGATSYVFNGEELSNASNPDFTFKRGSTYTFNINTPGHPFLIKSVSETGTANAYNEGVTNNGTESGTITFTVPSDAPNTLYYICEFHGSMSGTITITD